LVDNCFRNARREADLSINTLGIKRQFLRHTLFPHALSRSLVKRPATNRHTHILKLIAVWRVARTGLQKNITVSDFAIKILQGRDSRPTFASLAA